MKIISNFLIKLAKLLDSTFEIRAPAAGRTPQAMQIQPRSRSFERVGMSGKVEHRRHSDLDRGTEELELGGPETERARVDRSSLIGRARN